MKACEQIKDRRKGFTTNRQYIIMNGETVATQFLDTVYAV